MARHASHPWRARFCLVLVALAMLRSATVADALPPAPAAEGTAGANRLPVSGGVLAAAPLRPADAQDLLPRLERITRSAPGRISVWYYDLTRHEYFGLNADEVYTAASTVKVLIATYLYHLAATGQVSLDEPVAVYSVDWKQGSGILEGVPDGTRLSRRELARLMLVHSDNTAANALLRTLGVQPMVRYFRSLGIRYGTAEMQTPRQLWQHNRIAPQDLGMVLRNVWEAARRSPEPWAEMLAFMRQSQTKSRIPSGLPPDVPVANKTGSKETFFHDAAIVLDRHPYVLVVMTEGFTSATASHWIGSVSREVWRWHGRRWATP
ncbi:MAG: serine hydrolase [Symbiobacterium sp.]|uniref:serine hydrolase n=1 Tax=Symbiobacterium sp. TaxID=1971213 RepID=UPI00346446BD